MEILTYLIPVSLFLAGVGLAAFFWALKTRQFDDPEGDANRILAPDFEDRPKPQTSLEPSKNGDAVANDR